MNRHFLRALPALTLVLGAVSCTPSIRYGPPPAASFPAPFPGPRLYEWVDDHGPGEIRIRINRSTNIANFTRGGRDIGWSYVATGKPGNRTPAGNFRITEKTVDKYSNLYGRIEGPAGHVIDHDASSDDPVPPGGRFVPAPMPYWMRLTSYGIGMHAGPIPNPGQPASHGCIRLPKRFAPILFDAIRIGTEVTIH